MQGQNPEKLHFNVEPTLDWSAHLATLRYQRGAGDQSTSTIFAESQNVFLLFFCALSASSYVG
jgi:hypothetical protein